MGETGRELTEQPELGLPDFYKNVFGPGPETYRYADIQHRPDNDRLHGLIFMVDNLPPCTVAVVDNGGQVLWEETMFIRGAGVATCMDPEGRIFTIVEKNKE